MATTIRDALTFLQRFAAPDDLATECRRRSIRAVCKDANNCAVAALLFNEFPDISSIEIDPGDPFGTIEIGYWQNHPDDHKDKLPAAANDFASIFDEHGYPDLEMPPSA